MALRHLLVPAALVAALHPAAQAHGRGPSTPEERAHVLKLAADADKDPLAAMAAEGRWFDKWVDEVPDIMFGGEAPARWCEGAAKGDLRKVLRFQYQLSGIAYQIEHQLLEPKTLEHKLAIHQAALEGVLRAYETLRSKAPENRSEKMEEALALRAKGELPAFVKSLFAARR
ncbi:hypothetical protein GETHLI_30110 [Geothrix limicola]|uniref:Uncharacterized protein n=1 Tax=Geothrix limicola TaxID=2927978 RepID=A0ABQ5QIV5_9BACT|nr:hypothetical protein [Geothrix limicola]GLH74509.1 hypothetical protein GETHLI_30110 [Geothrix limicola]